MKNEQKHAFVNLETSAIIEAVRAGSDKILFQVYEAYRDEFVSWATRNHQVNVEEAKDVFQDSIVALYRNIKAGKVDDLDATIKTYLFGVGKNIILNALKRRGLEANVNEHFLDTGHNGIKDHYDREHLVHLVKRLYKAMGSPCKEILEMFYERGFDMESISSRLGYKNADVAKKKKYECLKSIEDRINMSRLKEILNG